MGRINSSITVTAVPEAELLFTTYSKSFLKPSKATGNGESDIWSQGNDDGARWMCQKSAASISEGEWSNVISLVGEVGAVPYNADEWTADRTYEKTKESEPWVTYTQIVNGKEVKSWYRKNKQGKLTGGKNPKDDYATSVNKESAEWHLVEEQQAMFFHVLWAEKAIIAGAVANLNAMFSQFGVLNGAESKEYWKEGFEPNILIDWANGLLKAKNVEIEGNIKAKKGTFSGLLSTPYLKKKNYYHNPENGLNILMGKNNADDDIMLAVHPELEGAESDIIRVGSDDYKSYITAPGNSALFCLGKAVVSITLTGSLSRVRLKAVALQGTGESISWVVMNPNDFVFKQYSSGKYIAVYKHKKTYENSEVNFSLETVRTDKDFTVTTESYVSCYNTTSKRVKLPKNPENGRCIYVKCMNKVTLAIDGNGITIDVNGQKLNDVTWIDDRGTLGVFLYDGQFWIYNKL